MMKKRLLPLILFVVCALSGWAQTADNDSIFCGRIENDEYQVWIEMNLYENNVKVPSGLWVSVAIKSSEP